VEPQAAHRYSHVFWNGEFHRLPEGFSGLVPADPEGLRHSSLLTPEGAERAAAEAQVPPRTEGPEESVSAFLSRRFGAEAFERLMEPLLSGIFAGDADELSAEAAFPQLVARERQNGSLTGGAAIPRDQGPAFRSFRRGMAQYPAALVDRLRSLGVDLVTGSTITRMERRGRGFQLWSSGGSWAADGVILALPPHAAGRVVADVVPRWAPVLNAWPTASVANLTMAFEERELPQLPGGSGFVAPRGTGLPFSAATWLSQKWPDRAPAGRVLVRVYFGGARNPDAWELPEDKLVEAGLALLGRFQPAGQPKPLWHRVLRWKDAFAQPNLGHAERHRALAQGGEGIVLAGGYFGGVGIPDCLARADEAARLVKTYLFQGDSSP